MSFIVYSFLWELDVGEILHEYFAPTQHMVRYDIFYLNETCHAFIGDNQHRLSQWHEGE